MDAMTGHCPQSLHNRGSVPSDGRGARLHGRHARVAAALLAVAAFMTDAASADRIAAVTTDWYSAGSISTLQTAPPWSAQVDLVSVHSDAVARVKDGRIYVVNRLGGDNVQVIDAVTFQTIRQFSVGAGTNPQDIAVISPTRAFVSRYETNDLLEVNPSTGQITGTISLAALADADGLCEMNRMHVRGGHLYVQVQRMLRQGWPDPWIPAPPSYLAVIDMTTNALVDVDPGTPGIQGIVLQGTNPIGPMQIEPETGYLLVPEAGRYSVIDNGGIERVCLDTWQSAGMAATESALGGDVLDFALWNAQRAYAIVTDPSFVTKLVSWNPSTGQMTGTVYNPGGYTLSDLMTHHAGYLYLADRNYHTPGVRVYNAATGLLLAGPIDTGLPPYELVLIPDPTSDVPGFAEGRGLFYPNPSPGEVRFSWTDGRTERPASVEVFDLAGRVILRLSGGLHLRSGGALWDGLDSRGGPAPAGVYFLRVAGSEGGHATGSVRILR